MRWKKFTILIVGMTSSRRKRKWNFLYPWTFLLLSSTQLVDSQNSLIHFSSECEPLVRLGNYLSKENMKNHFKNFFYELFSPFSQILFLLTSTRCHASAHDTTELFSFLFYFLFWIEHKNFIHTLRSSSIFSSFCVTFTRMAPEKGFFTFFALDCSPMLWCKQLVSFFTQ